MLKKLLFFSTSFLSIASLATATAITSGSGVSRWSADGNSTFQADTANYSFTFVANPAGFDSIFAACSGLTGVPRNGVVDMQCTTPTSFSTTMTFGSGGGSFSIVPALSAPGPLQGTLSGVFTATGPQTLISTNASGLATAPSSASWAMTFSGTLQVANIVGQTVFQDAFTATGTATTRIVANPDGSNARTITTWIFTSAPGDPTPEPSTLAMLGVAVIPTAWMLATRRRSSRRNP